MQIGCFSSNEIWKIVKFWRFCRNELSQTEENGNKLSRNTIKHNSKRVNIDLTDIILVLFQLVPNYCYNIKFYAINWKQIRLNIKENTTFYEIEY